MLLTLASAQGVLSSSLTASLSLAPGRGVNSMTFTVIAKQSKEFLRFKSDVTLLALRFFDGAAALGVDRVDVAR